MLDAGLGKLRRDELRLFDGGRADQHGAALLMDAHNLHHRGTPLAVLGAEHHVRLVLENGVGGGLGRGSVDRLSEGTSR